MCLDYSLACSGYTVGLSMAYGLLATRQASCVLLVNTDTYSRITDEEDRSTRVLFSDGAAVSMIESSDDKREPAFSFGSAGAHASAFACPLPSLRGAGTISMNGFAVWKFIKKTLPTHLMELIIQQIISLALVTI